MLIKAIKKLYTTNLGARKDENILIFTDTLLSDEEVTTKDKLRREKLVDLAAMVAKVGRDMSHNITFLTYPSLKGPGMEPPEDIWIAAFGTKNIKELKENRLLERLIKKEIDDAGIKDIEDIIRRNKADAQNVIVALSNFSTTHTRFRDLFTHICNGRYASMPLFDEAMFYGPMQVNWDDLSKRTKDLAKIMDAGDKIFVSAPNGTDMTIGISGRKILADTGVLTEPGASGNLPAGEVFVAPVEGTTEGIMILEWASTSKLKSPIILEVEKGVVKNVKGDDPYAEILRRKLKENIDFKNIAELGIGTNDMAKRADNILESEKILGTVHIALGDNSTFGGTVRTPFHQDFVIFEPTVRLLKGKEDIVILKRGQLLSSCF